MTLAPLTAFVLVVAAACRPAPGSMRSAPPGASSHPAASAGAGAEGTGRWLAWSGPGRVWGSFITPSAVGPRWSLDVAGSAHWSKDGRWLTTCASDFVAARWMGSARPSRVAVLGGSCESLMWAPRGSQALVLSKASNQARLVSFTAGERPQLSAASFEIKLPDQEKLYPSQFFQWSPAADSFLVSVLDPSPGMPLRWVDVAHQPGTVRRLVTESGFEAQGGCFWAPNGKRVACRAFAADPGRKKGDRAPLREALALFEIERGEISGRTLFEALGFALVDLGWLDATRLVFTDRDATRLVDVSGAEPPITLSAAAGDFAVSPSAPFVAYQNHRGLCVRGGGELLGPEQLLAPGPLRGVTWSDDGRHLLTYRPDGRVALVVADALSKSPRIHRTTEVAPQLALHASFSTSGTRLLTRTFPRKGATSAAQPMLMWQLSDFVPHRLIPEGFVDRWVAASPDDTALVVSQSEESGALFLGRVHGGKTSLQPFAERVLGGSVDWQPGSRIAASATPAPLQPSDPYRQRVALVATHPLSLGTAYVVGSRKCSGALVDPYYLVTAHHCVEDTKRPATVVLGRGQAWQREYTVPPYRILHHPKLRYVKELDLFEYDLALVELPEPAPTQARPFTLARADEGTPGLEIFLAGYGGDHGVGLSAQPELRYGISRLIPVTGAAAMLGWRSPEGAENGGCFGDSGGPALLRRGDGSFALLGIHFGTGGTDYTKICGRDGMAGNLAAERAWLNEALDKLTISRRGAGPPRPHAPL
jgi:hypothetical protein